MKFGEHLNITAATVQTIKTPNKTTALTVATVQKVHWNQGTRHRVLLDTGSQLTFITKALANKLQLKPVKTIKLQVEGFLGCTLHYSKHRIKST